MPASQVFANTEVDLSKKLQDCLKDGNKVLLLFEGSTNIATGDSWHEDCRKIESLLEPLLEEASENVHFIMVEVGDEEKWKDVTNVFKRDDVFQLRSLPTLLLLDGPKSVKSRLEGTACLDQQALKEFF